MCPHERAARIAECDAQRLRLRSEIRALNLRIAWVNVQIFWHAGYGPVALAAAISFLAVKVLS